MAMVRRRLFLSLYLRVILGLSVTETTLLACLSMIANSVSQASIWGIAMIIFNSLSGVSMALINVVGYLVASELIPAEHRGKLFGQFNAINGISFRIACTAIGRPIADHLISKGVPQAYITTFEAATIISLIGTIIYLIKVKA